MMRKNGAVADFIRQTSGMRERLLDGEPPPSARSSPFRIGQSSCDAGHATGVGSRRDCTARSGEMAKGQMRGNREAKKPKQVKPKTIAAASPYADTKGKASPAPSGKKR